MTTLASFLAGCQRAPRGRAGKSGTILGQEGAKDLAAVAAVRWCLAGRGDFTGRQIWEASPELKARYQVPNYVATVLGDGQYGGGLGLDRAGDAFRASPNNLGLCVRHLLGRRGIALDDEADVRQGVRCLAAALGVPGEALEAQLAHAEATPSAAAAQPEARETVAC